jgi:heme/copper-type cytochrome/quinol oxidase subunit 2
MNLINILYEPYVIIIFSSLFITLIAYFVIINQKNKEKNKDNQTNISKTLLYTFIISFILLTLIKFILSYANTNKLFIQKGGDINPVDNLTIIADDVDFNIIDD